MDHSILSFDLRKKGFPLYVIPLGYLAVSLIFPDRWNYLIGVVLACVLYLGSYGLGKQLSFFFFKTADQKIYTILGLGFVLSVSYLLFTFSTKPLVLYCIWGFLLLFAVFEFPVFNYRMPRAYWWGAPLVLLGFWSSFTPTTFFDALVYHLGLPSEYLITGKMSVWPNYLYSSFPPFGLVLNTLFLGLKSESGIKLFSILMYFQIIAVLVSTIRWFYVTPVRRGGNGRDQDGYDAFGSIRSEFVVFAALLIPSVWIQTHIVTGDMLVALFFCAAVITLVKECEDLTNRKIATIAFLFAFSIWTKWNVLLYVLLLPVLWFFLVRKQWRELGFLYGWIFLLILPLLVRNYLNLGDPFFPSLSGIFNTPTWTTRQSLAIELDSLSGGVRGITEILLAPFRLTFQPGFYGPASPIGLIPLTTILIYPFTRKIRRINHVLIYVGICYVAWLFSFHNFRQFFPPFVLMLLASYSSVQFIAYRYPKFLIPFWLLAAVVCAFFLLPVHLRFFPLLSPTQSQQDYLKQNLDYFPMAEAIYKDSPQGSVMLLGQTRIAHFQNLVVAATAYDQHPVLKYLETSNSSDNLFGIFRRNDIRSLLVHVPDWELAYRKYGLLPIELVPQEIASQKSLTTVQRAASGAVPLQVSAEKVRIWQEFVKRFGAKKLRIGNELFLYKISEDTNTSFSTIGDTSAQPGCQITVRTEQKGHRIILTNSGSSADFHQFQVRVDQGGWKDAPDEFVMLDPFTVLECRTVDRNGTAGRPGKFIRP